MASVFDVANLFIQVANQSEDDQITNLKLNKLLYYAQGAYLARTGRKLFEEDIEAWNLGPVVPNIYRKYRVCGREPIPITEGETDLSRFKADELDTIFDVMREFGKYTGSTLVSMTHKPGTPWSNAESAGKSIITPEDIKTYFIQHPVPTFNCSIKSPQVTVLPAEWYDPNEDSEWEGYL